jgi:hypothetical protein
MEKAKNFRAFFVLKNKKKKKKEIFIYIKQKIILKKNKRLVTY